MNWDFLRINEEKKKKITFVKRKSRAFRRHSPHKQGQRDPSWNERRRSEEVEDEGQQKKDQKKRKKRERVLPVAHIIDSKPIHLAFSPHTLTRLPETEGNRSQGRRGFPWGRFPWGFSFTKVMGFFGSFHYGHVTSTVAGQLLFQTSQGSAVSQGDSKGLSKGSRSEEKERK